jgi:glycosyltransferase involved in cell wall biosynthesis
LKREQFDVVHIHTEQAFFWYGLTARLGRVPCVVYHVHGCLPFRGSLRWERIVQRWIARSWLRMVCLVVSRSVQRNERDRFLNPSTVVNNWVDAGVFTPLEAEKRSEIRRGLGLPQDAVLLISVGSCTELKRHALIIDAVERLHGEGLSIGYVHVGSGSLEKAERRRAMRLQVQECCYFLGELDNVHEVLAACDVFVMPSEREGLGLAALEALSCGVSVVVTDSPGLTDLVVHGVTGLIAAPTAASLASAIRRVLADDHLRQSLGLAGRLQALSEYAPPQGVQGWLAAYGECLP